MPETTVFSILQAHFQTLGSCSSVHTKAVATGVISRSTGRRGKDGTSPKQLKLCLRVYKEKTKTDVSTTFH